MKQFEDSASISSDSESLDSRTLPMVRPEINKVTEPNLKLVAAVGVANTSFNTKEEPVAKPVSPKPAAPKPAPKPEPVAKKIIPAIVPAAVIVAAVPKKVEAKPTPESTLFR